MNADVAVGIVQHGRPGFCFALSAEVEILAHVNADMGARTPWRGFGENHNALIDKASRASWYVALNPDVHCTGDDLIRMVVSAEEAGYSVVGPVVVSPWGVRPPASYEPSPGAWIREAVGFGGAVRERGRTRVVPAAWVSGACLAFKLDSGLRFDTRYFMYFEDVDLCIRAHNAGLKVGVCSSVTVEHSSGWRADDPLIRRRGVEFARSALRYADTRGISARRMRLAGLVRFGSRRLVAARHPAQAASAAISRGFLTLDAPGLSELAAVYNAELE